jgi:hypothetical protein
MDNFDDFHTEVVTSGRVPYELVLMRRIDALGQGIISSDDGGVSAGLALVNTLPSQIYEQLKAEGYVKDIEKYLSLRITIRREVHKQKRHIPPSTHLEPKMLDGAIIGGMGTETVVADGKGKTAFVPVSNYKLHQEFWSTKGAQREFASRLLRRIIDLLDAAGILWRTRIEKIGSDDN